jgi:uncharacterized OB-fold protein
VEEVLLSRRGKLWSFTTNYYKPPAPYRSPDPYVPFGVAIVEFPKEKIKIQGQIASGYDSEALKVGSEMELILEKLHEDEQGNELIVWKFKPV